MRNRRRIAGTFRFISESRFILYYSLAERLFFFLFFILIARRFHVENYGELITALAVANGTAIMFDLGIPIHLQKEISSGKPAGKLLPSAISLSMILLPLFFLLSVVIGKSAYQIPVSLMVLICAPVYLFSVSNLLNKVLAGLEDYRSQFEAVSYSRISALLLLFYFYYAGYESPVPYLVILLVTAIVQVLLLLFRIRERSGGEWKWFTGFSGLRYLYPVVPLGAAVAFNFLYDKIDILLISGMLGFAESAIYSIAYGIFKAASLSYTFFLTPALTKISYLGRRLSAVRLYLAKYTFIIFIICICSFAAIFLASDFLVELLYGVKYSESSSLLKVLSIATLGMGLNNLYGVALNGLGLYKENLYVTLFGLVINILINIMLIPSMGIMGAVIATVATEYFVLAADSYFLNNYLKGSE